MAALEGLEEGIEAAPVLSPEEAFKANAAIPFAADRGPPATGTRLKFASEEDGRRAADCLTAAVYYEAGTQPPEVRRAVAQVVMNRLRHEAFPKTVCGVVFEGASLPGRCQFNFTCDGSLGRMPDVKGWEEAKATAERALTGGAEPVVGLATRYHSVWTLPPWTKRMEKMAQVKDYLFYRWVGPWGAAEAMQLPYRGREPWSPGPVGPIDPGADIAAPETGADAPLQLGEGSSSSLDIPPPPAAAPLIELPSPAPVEAVRRPEPAPQVEPPQAPPSAPPKAAPPKRPRDLPRLPW